MPTVTSNRQACTDTEPKCAIAHHITNTYLKSVGVGTDDLLDGLALVEDDKGGHGLDADLGRDLFLRIDVDLVEVDLVAGGRVRDLLEDGADDPARTAPGSPEVNDDGLVAFDLFAGQRARDEARIVRDW